MEKPKTVIDKLRPLQQQYQDVWLMIQASIMAANKKKK